MNKLLDALESIASWPYRSRYLDIFSDVLPFRSKTLMTGLWPMRSLVVFVSSTAIGFCAFLTDIRGQEQFWFGFGLAITMTVAIFWWLYLSAGARAIRGHHYETTKRRTDALRLAEFEIIAVDFGLAAARTTRYGWSSARPETFQLPPVGVLVRGSEGYQRLLLTGSTVIRRASGVSRSYVSFPEADSQRDYDELGTGIRAELYLTDAHIANLSAEHNPTFGWLTGDVHHI